MAATARGFVAAAALCAVVGGAGGAVGCKSSSGGPAAGGDAAGPSASAGASAVSARAGSASADAGASAGPGAGADAGVPPDDLMPPASSDELTARARHLLEAVGKDDADLAADIEFPRNGWLAMRDAEDTGKDWSKRVDGPFRKSLHGYFKRHESIGRAQFVSFELGHAVVQTNVHKHGWKKPLWTVHGSHLTYVVDGHTRTLVVHEMTAWRGAWYVTRLR